MRKPHVGPVSRETRARLETYVAELRRWQPALNLVSSRSLADVWRRHVDDCLQLAQLESGAGSWLDLGSGSGLPGLIIAAVDSAPKVTLIEADSRKCAFLRSTARLMRVKVEVVESRIEIALATRDIRAEAVTARALAPLTDLLRYAEPVLSSGGVGVFPKGRNYAAELTAARESWNLVETLIPSRTDPDGRILRIASFSGARTRRREADER